MLTCRQGGELKRICRTTPEVAEILCSEVRFEFLKLLGQRPRTVSELMRELGLKAACASRNLGILRHASLVDYDAQKKDHLYSLSRDIEASVEADEGTGGQPKSHVVR